VFFDLRDENAIEITGLKTPAKRTAEPAGMVSDTRSTAGRNCPTAHLVQPQATNPYADSS
jgi:hypothetical protein